VAALPDDLAPAAGAIHRDADAGGPATPVADRAATRRVRAAVRAYFLLTKPRVIELLLVTTVPAMVLAEDGLPSLGLILAVLLGGAMAAGGANTINCWIERDRDSLMRRTHGRPLPRGDVSPTGALVFGLVLEAAAFALLWVTSNLLAAVLAVSATVFYVFVYTLWLKPRSAQNIVIGGAAGAVPVLVGWAAVTGSLAAPAWAMFAIIFFWTPPHFWALSIRYRDDYRAAGIPMLPVVRGIPVAARQIVVYAIVVLATSLLLGAVSTLSWGYVVAAVVLGGLFVVQSLRLQADPTPARAIRLFTFSNTYLALLFAAIAVDTLARAI
jgi:protoheme IX farnesyltransferase